MRVVSIEQWKLPGCDKMIRVKPNKLSQVDICDLLGTGKFL